MPFSRTNNNETTTVLSSVNLLLMCIRKDKVWSRKATKISADISRARKSSISTDVFDETVALFKVCIIDNMTMQNYLLDRME